MAHQPTIALLPDENKIEFSFVKDALKNLETRQEFYGFEFNGVMDMLTK